MGGEGARAAAKHHLVHEMQERTDLQAGQSRRQVSWCFFHCPIEDRRRWGSSRPGMFWGLSIGNYLLLVDYTGRLLCEGKATISSELAGILDRIGSTAESSQVQMEELKSGRSFGRFFAASRDRLQSLAIRLNVRRLVNLVGCTAP